MIEALRILLLDDTGGPDAAAATAEAVVRALDTSGRAVLFAGIGLWLGRGNERERIVTREVTIEVPVEVPAAAAAPGFVLNQAKVEELELTRRELEVLQLMADGLSNREMAERLCISENTIKTHCSRLFDKLGAGRRTQAVQLARGLRLIP